MSPVQYHQAYLAHRRETPHLRPDEAEAKSRCPSRVLASLDLSLTYFKLRLQTHYGGRLTVRRENPSARIGGRGAERGLSTHQLTRWLIGPRILVTVTTVYCYFPNHL